MAVTDEEKIDRNVSWEIARLKTFDPPIRPDTVAYEVDEKGRAYISFEMETDVLLETEATPIQDVEPIILRYSSEGAIGRRAPSVFSGRPDFPRHLPHINPSANEEPAWLCLARSGLQQIYNADGIAGVVMRLIHWLNDAKTGKLSDDGWEPVPALDFEACVVGRINAANLQEHANKNPSGGGAFFVAGLSHRDPGFHYVDVDETPLELSDNERVKTAKSLMAMYDEAGRFQTYLPALFVWPDKNQVETIAHFNTWRDMSSLREGLRQTGLKERVGEFFDLIDVYFRHGPDGRPPDLDHYGQRSKKALLLIVGLWRPIGIDQTIVGLSNDEEARKLELRVFYLERPAAEERWSDTTIVRDFLGLIPCSTDLLEAVSGEPALPHVTLLGVGALGSALADFALRGGTPRLTVVDKDRLLPHNLARHLGFAVETWEDKTKIVQRQAAALAAGSVTTAYTDDIVGLTDDDLNGRCDDATLIIDATADPLVRSRLSHWREKDVPILRFEIFHKGRLGVCLMTRSASPLSLNCLYYQVVLYALENRWIREWLAYEATRTFRDEELLIGFGCASQTTALPKYKVDAHAAAAFALARKAQGGEWPARIALHRLDEDGVSEGTEMLQTDEVEVFEGGDDLNGWKIIVTRDVIKQMRKLKEEKAPNETGGYLYGGLDETASEIYIVAASPEPPGTNGSPTNLELGPCGRTQFERNIIKKTSSRLSPLGSWHSHPRGAPTASTKDWFTLAKFRQDDKRYGQPTIIAITGTTGERFYVAAE